MSDKVSQIKGGNRGSSLEISDDCGTLIVRLVYSDRNEALRAGGLLEEDAISRAIQISSVS
jgi:hypothetical protein